MSACLLSGEGNGALFDTSMFCAQWSTFSRSVVLNTAAECPEIMPSNSDLRAITFEMLALYVFISADSFRKSHTWLEIVSPEKRILSFLSRMHTDPCVWPGV